MTRTAIALASAIFLVAACTTPTASPGGGGASGPAPTGTSGSPAAGGTIKIGGGFALTGAESALDLPASNGAMLAVKQINAEGGVNGCGLAVRLAISRTPAAAGPWRLSVSTLPEASSSHRVRSLPRAPSAGWLRRRLSHWR